MPKLALMPFEREVVTINGVRFLCLMAGRGGGKTHAIQARIKYVCTKYRRFQYMYISPVSDLALEVFNELIADADFRRFIKSHSTRPYPEIKLKNGSVVKFRSFQRPEAIRGKNMNEICIDESQSDEFTESALDTILNPMLRTPS